MREAVKALPPASTPELLSEGGTRWKAGSASFASVRGKILALEFECLGLPAEMQGALRAGYGKTVSALVKRARKEGVPALPEKQFFEWLNNYFHSHFGNGQGKDGLLVSAVPGSGFGPYALFILAADARERVGKPSRLVLAGGRALIAGDSHCLDVAAEGGGAVFPIGLLSEKHPGHQFRSSDKILSVAYTKAACEYGGRGDAEGAIRCCMEALEENPADDTAPFILGTVYFGLGKLAEADKWLGKALTADPDNAEAWYRKGVASSMMKNNAEAIHCLEAALRLSPGSFDAENRLCTIYIREGDDESAILHGMNALQLRPDSAFTHNNVGVAHLNRGEAEQGAKFLEEAVRLDPDFGLAHRNLGMAYERLGLSAKAASHFRKAAQLSVNKGLPDKSGE